MEKFLESIQEAEKIIKTADHMAHITFPLIKDKRLLLKVLLETKRAITKCINSILHYEYNLQRIILSKSAKTNFRTFSEQCALKYGITKKEIKLILEIFDIVERYNQSPMEFIRKEKLVILSDNLKPKIITLEEIKEFLLLAKKLLNNTKERILR